MAASGGYTDSAVAFPAILNDNLRPMCRVLICLCVLLAASTLHADEILFKNGDRVKGTVAGMELRHLRISTENFGDVTCDLDKVDHFSTEQPVSLIMEDGRVQKMRILLYQDGMLYLNPNGLPTTRPTTAPTTQPATQSATTPTTLPATTRATTSPTTTSQPIAPPGTTRSIPIAQVARIGPAKAPWSGNVVVGATAQTGNTNAVNVAAGYEINRRGDTDRIQSTGSLNYGQQQDPSTQQYNTTVDNWAVNGSYDYFLTRQWYLYTGGGLTHDQLQDLYLRATPGGGVGYQWVESDRTNVSTELGLAWVYERYTSPQQLNEYWAARIAWHVDDKLTNNVSVIHNFEMLPRLANPSDVVINADLGLRVNITGHLFTELKAVLSYNSEPAQSKQDLDMQYKALLGYQF